MINLRRIPLENLGNAFLKRAFDIVGAAILIVVTSPLMLLAAVGVKLSSPGPIIFRQVRVGKNKKEFYMYKFRSMRVNAKQQTGWSRDVDPRKTAFGSFIRKFSIDELPQFFNVLKGDMSLVGPRPEVPHFVEQFKEEIPRYMVKHQVRPGITGWAQVNGLRGETGWSRDVDPRKTAFGSFIRKFSIDELPQFFNVLKGDMSLVGPRPEVPHFVEQFKEEIPRYMVKHQVRPGITGWAQVNGLRGDTSIRERIEHDLYYIENWNILFDVKILLMTLFRAVNKEKINL